MHMDHLRRPHIRLMDGHLYGGENTFLHPLLVGGGFFRATLGRAPAKEICRKEICLARFLHVLWISRYQGIDPAPGIQALIHGAKPPEYIFLAELIQEMLYQDNSKAFGKAFEHVAADEGAGL